jgi:hypothetical protein
LGGWFLLTTHSLGVDMIYLKRKDGSVFGKKNPSKEQIKIYMEDGCVLCDENGKEKKEKKSGKKSSKR